MGKAFDMVASQIPCFGEALRALPEEVKERTFDIRLKSGQPVCLCGYDGFLFLKKDGAVTKKQQDDLPVCSLNMLQEIFFQVCGQSVFCHEEEIREGYISLHNGCRVGVCGTAAVEKSGIKSLREVTSLVFRIPREKRGCADKLFLSGLPIRQGVLVVGPPSSGKTTFLRDLASSLAGGKFSSPARVAVLDQRGELGGRFNLGPGADILRGYPKPDAFDIALRMFSPEYLVCDELAPKDLKAVRSAIFGGAAVIASVHGEAENVLERPLCQKLFKSDAFAVTVFLKGRESPGEIASLKKTKELWKQVERLQNRKEEAA